MPSPEQILYNLSETSAQWNWLAVVWHAALGALLVALIAGWRPRKRLAGILLVLVPVSVSVVAWAQKNPFNGIIFGAAALALLMAIRQIQRDSTAIAPHWQTIPGAVLIGFGWIYPHFLGSEYILTYLYAAPFGIIPCPSLSVVIGLTPLMGLTKSSAWSLILASLGLFYGAIGSFRLGVWIDLALLAGSLFLATTSLAQKAGHMAKQEPSSSGQ